MSLADRPGSWPVLSNTDLHRDDWVVALRRDRIHPPGEPDHAFDRLVVEHPGAAIVLALDAEENACLLRQYRHASAGTFVELPAGLCDVAGEDPVETARRELREEAGLDAASWRHLLTTVPSAGITSERQHLYLAREVTPAEDVDFTPAHEEARMEVHWAPLAELYESVLAGRVSEGPLAVAVLAYVALRDRGEL
ncbi:NUDIX hydrolase [Nocardioides panacisoli]|uniref:NUDIX domain-containing protein n=1 Tax=Nocardioides panacisoli TaxID=627624 RepID=UPI001C62C648|nr:NUDIX hydrolase [Nocardioides panacisoli]QYJ05142.1 NUDIX hydrolase [Nocardioides panacisoli]